MTALTIDFNVTTKMLQQSKLEMRCVYEVMKMTKCKRQRQRQKREQSLKIYSQKKMCEEVEEEESDDYIIT